MNALTRRLAPLLTTLLVLAAAPGCGAGDPDQLADLGSYGSMLSREVQGAALEAFLSSPEARERFAQAYSSLHHVADSDALIAGLTADPALSALADRVRGSIQAGLASSDRDARRVKKDWRDPRIQRAVTHAVAGALLAGLQAAEPSSAAEQAGKRPSAVSAASTTGNGPSPAGAR